MLQVLEESSGAISSNYLVTFFKKCCHYDNSDNSDNRIKEIINDKF